jgi:uncharacterized protein YcbX
MATGTVSRLWRWPVKSMAGEEVRALSLGPRGVGGDRTHAVLHEHKGAWRPLTAREAPGLLAWRAAYPFNLDAGLDPEHPPHAIVTEPAGSHSWRWGDPHLRSALERDLGRPVRLERDTGGIPDVPGTVLVTVAATLAALSRELGTEVDARRFRTNLHLELDAEPWAELAWAGARIELAGGVRLTVDGPCERCAIPTRDPDTREKWPELLQHLAAAHGQDFGLLARVSARGRASAGESVRIVTS